MKSGVADGHALTAQLEHVAEPCTKIRTTKPIANGSPQIHAYAAIETSIDAAVVKTLSLKRSAPYLTIRKPIARTGAKSFRTRSRDRTTVDRLVAAVTVERGGIGQRCRLRRLERPVRVIRLLAQLPRPIHSSPPTYTSFFQSGTDTFNSSIASRHAASASARCGAETAMTTLVSPMSTPPDPVVDRHPAQAVGALERVGQLLHDLSLPSPRTPRTRGRGRPGRASACASSRRRSRSRPRRPYAPRRRRHRSRAARRRA